MPVPKPNFTIDLSNEQYKQKVLVLDLPEDWLEAA